MKLEVKNVVYLEYDGNGKHMHYVKQIAVTRPKSQTGPGLQRL